MLNISRSDLSTHAVTLVANAVTRIVLPNIRRISLLLVNDSDIDAFIAERDNVATTGDLVGIPLRANLASTFGLSAVVGFDGLKRIYDGEIYAVSTGAAVITISEESEID
jgi:hypothetical protein